MTEGILERRNTYTLPAPAAESSIPSIKSVSRALRRGQALAYRRAQARAFWRSVYRPFMLFVLWLTAVLTPVRQASSRSFIVSASAVLNGSRVVLNGMQAAAVGAADTARDVKLFLGRHPVKRATVAFAFCSIVAITFFTSFYRIGLEVTLSGRSIGYIGNQSEFDDAVASVSARASEVLGRPYLLNPDVSYKFTLVTRNDLFNREEVEAQLFNEISEVKNLYVLTVDGEVIGGTQSGVALQSILDDLLNEYPKESYVDTTSFVRDVQISRQLVAAHVESSPAEMAELLNSNVRDEQIHVVSDGDTWESIAAHYGMSVDTLIAQNGADANKSPEAYESLLINNRVPYLSVESTRRIYFTEPIAFEVEEVDEPGLYIGESEVRVPGVEGTVQVMADVISIDGNVIDQTEVGRVVLTPPSTQIVAKGTTKRPPKYPTGKFIKPSTGRLTSGFGRRYLFGTWSNHTGIDLAGPIGTSIVASDGGTVTFVGEKSGYGKTVIVTHLNGQSTLYAHCSALLVEQGQKVGQGERIAKVGNSGRSTGPHVHFEIRINGTPVNPLNYIKA